MTINNNYLKYYKNIIIFSKPTDIFYLNSFVKNLGLLQISNRKLYAIPRALNKNPKIAQPLTLYKRH